MNKHHELTNKIWSRNPIADGKDGIDRLVREWLECAVQKILADDDRVSFTPKDLRILLGLTEPRTEKCDCQSYMVCQCSKRPQAPKQKEWCNHLFTNEISGTPQVGVYPLPEATMFCPICGTRKPEPVDTVTEFVTLLRRENFVLSEQDFQKLAKIAHEYFKETR